MICFRTEKLGEALEHLRSDKAAFTDVPTSAWYASDIAKLYAAGIMLGGGTMRPMANLTCEEAAVR